MKIFKNSVQISHDIVQNIVCKGDYVVDATAGNGNDTVFLAKLVGEKGHVYSFDIQETAVYKTREKLLKENMLDFVTLINDGHENIDKYINYKVKAVIFNLGYLPGKDHSIHTKPETTIEAVKKCLKLLQPHGIIALVVYQGGDTGFDEKNAVMEFVKNLNPKNYTVLVNEFINQINYPPTAVCIQIK